MEGDVAWRVGCRRCRRRWWRRWCDLDSVSRRGVVAARDRDKALVFLCPWDARELVLIEHDVLGDVVLVGLRVVALETLVPIFHPQVDASLSPPLLHSTLLLLHMDVGATAKDPNEGEIRLLAKFNFVR